MSLRAKTGRRRRRHTGRLVKSATRFWNKIRVFC